MKDSTGRTVNSNPATVTVNIPAVRITQQPKSSAINLGQSVTLSIKAEGAGLKYQWYFKKRGDSKWSLWKGRTHASESVTPNDSWDGIQLYCVVRDSAGKTVKSDTAIVLINS